MIQVIRRPGGGWVRQADGSKGAKLWHNVRGKRTLTKHGRDNLQNWYDLTIHIPCFEQELENPHHAHHDFPRQTWYPVSESSLPPSDMALSQILHLARFNPRVATEIPQNVKDWILDLLAGPPDPRGHRVLDVGSGYKRTA